MASKPTASQAAILQHLTKGASLMRAYARPEEVTPFRQHKYGIVLFAADGRQLRPVDDRTIDGLMRRGHIRVANSGEVAYELVP